MTAVADTILNGVDTATMFGTLDLIKAQPELARFEFRATNRWIDGAHNRSTIKSFYAAGGEDTSRSQAFVLDAGEPAILLGTDTGPNPAEYLLHALAACLTTSIVYVAAARKVELTSIESTLTGVMDVRGALGVDPEPRNGFERIGVSFRVAGNAPAEKLREVVERAGSVRPSTTWSPTACQWPSRWRPTERRRADRAQRSRRRRASRGDRRALALGEQKTGHECQPVGRLWGFVGVEAARAIPRAFGSTARIWRSRADAGGGTRIPDTRIMIPSRFGTPEPKSGAGGHKGGQIVRRCQGSDTGCRHARREQRAVVVLRVYRAASCPAEHVELVQGGRLSGFVDGGREEVVAACEQCWMLRADGGLKPAGGASEDPHSLRAVAAGLAASDSVLTIGASSGC